MYGGCDKVVSQSVLFEVSLVLWYAFVPFISLYLLWIAFNASTRYLVLDRWVGTVLVPEPFINAQHCSTASQLLHIWPIYHVYLRIIYNDGERVATVSLSISMLNYPKSATDVLRQATSGIYTRKGEKFQCQKDQAEWPSRERSFGLPKVHVMKSLRLVHVMVCAKWRTCVVLRWQLGNLCLIPHDLTRHLVRLAVLSQDRIPQLDEDEDGHFYPVFLTRCSQGEKTPDFSVTKRQMFSDVSCFGKINKYDASGKGLDDRNTHGATGSLHGIHSLDQETLELVYTERTGQT